MTFDAIFVPEELREAVSDRAWVEAMLETERALANAEALAGIVPAHLAGPVAEACRIELFDVAAIVEAGRSVGNPAEPLVRALRARVGGEAAGYVHFGATSQDIVDSAAMLVARRALGLVADEVNGVASACAALAEEHRMTPMAARTLLQQAVPTTFGLKAAGWLGGVHSARVRLEVVAEGLQVQLGGAGGTLSVLGPAGPKVADLLAGELDLAEQPIPWHAERSNVAEIGAVLAIAAGVCAKVATDVVLLEQTEVAEVGEPPGEGGSSTMPQKRNPVGSTIAVACERRVRAATGILFGSLVSEHERAVGGWHAEWGALSDALAHAGGAAAAVRQTLEGLDVDVARMRANLGDDTFSERATFVLARRVGLEQAKETVTSALAGGTGFREALGDVLTGDELEETFDLDAALGSAGAFVDEALAFFRRHDG